jgi:hypothetical protein
MQARPDAGRPGTKGASLEISVGQDGRNVLVSLDQPQADFDVHIRNLTRGPIKLTHLAIGFAGVYTPIKAIELSPEGSADMPLLIDLQRVHLPYSTLVCVLGEQGQQKIRSQALVTITTKDVVVFDQRTLLWRTGEPTAAKTVRIISIPAGLKPKEVWVVGAFKAELKGATIIVTPNSTAYPASGRLALATEPNDRHPTIVTLIVQPSIAGGAENPGIANSTHLLRSLPRQSANP